MALASGRFGSVIDTIGRTPVVPLRRLGAGLAAQVWVKLESRNPGGSVKDRIGRGMIDDAEARGLIRPGETVLVEPTSGNTGIAIARCRSWLPRSPHDAGKHVGRAQKAARRIRC